MTTRRKTFLLLMPSLLSGVTTGIVTGGIALVVAWSHISSQGLFYDFLFGRLGVTTILLSTPTTFFALKDTILGSSVTYYLLVATIAVMVGVLSYALLQRLGWIQQDAKLVTDEFRTHDPRLKATIYTDVTRLGVRLASLLALLLYVVTFVNILWPFVVSLIQVGLIKINEGALGGWLDLAEAIILLGVSLHLHAVFARLCMLRLRLFGDVVE